MAQVWSLSKNGGSRLLVELAIADHVNSAGIAWPSARHLASKTKLSERQVLRIIKQLEISGELIVNRDKHYNVYSIVLSDKMSLSDEKEGDIQSQEDDTQGQEGDTQGQEGDTAVSVKSLLNHNEIIRESDKNQKFSQEDESINIWEKLLDVLKFEKSNIFKQLSSYHEVTLNDDNFIIWVPDLFQADYLNNRVAKTLERILPGITARSIKVKFAIKVHEYLNI